MAIRLITLFDRGVVTLLSNNLLYRVQNKRVIGFGVSRYGANLDVWLDETFAYDPANDGLAEWKNGQR